MNLSKHWAAPLDDYVIDLAWAPDGALLAAASSAGPIALLAAEGGAKRHELAGHEQGTNCLGFAPATGASPILATGGQDGAVKFWDAGSGQHLATSELGSAWVEHLAWRPRSSAGPASAPLVAASAGRKLIFLSAEGSIRHTGADAPKTVTALAWDPTGGCVAAAAFGGVRLWDADDFIIQKELPYANGIHALTWSPDGKWLVSGNQDPSVHLWQPEPDLELHMSGYEGKVKYLSFDHTSRWLATSGGRDTCVWDCSGAGPEGRDPAMLPHETPVCAVAYQLHHGLLATGAEDGTVHLWSPDRNQPLRATAKLPSPATKLAWSPDDRLLAIGSEKGIAYVLRCEA